ncbi:MAG: gliding motility lipoprotein GldH [Lentimicrobiaceae bacterium]|nr:gliding motility lipoprotein GldH [Lentimicrobiaceae bacterium]
MEAKNKLSVFCLALCGTVWLTASSCQRSTLLNKTFDTPQPAWAYHEPVCFDLMVEDTTLPYDVTFSLKHTRNFEWMNAFFLITTVFPDMNTTIDTLECVLAMPDGRWLGSRLGKYRSLGFLYKQHIRFPMPGQYRFEVRHAMRNDSLQNINSVGLQIRRS